jgi:uncharacterized protein
MAAHSPGAGRGKCPICGRPTEAAYRPFCSRRCADIDLSRWLSGAYTIPDEADSEDGGVTGEPPAGQPPSGNGRRE